jgi:hypothetical protein
MSNDLISRKALMVAINTDFYEHFTAHHDSDQTALIDMVMQDIEEIPTAYDVDAVCQELEKFTKGECTLHECGIRSERCNACMAGKAIEIVKKGGRKE